MKKAFMFAAAFTVAFAASVFFLLQSDVHAQIYNNSSTTTATGTVGATAATSTVSTGTTNGTTSTGITPGLPNTGGGGARYIK